MKDAWFFESAIESITTTGTDLAASSIGAPRPSKEVAAITIASAPPATASSSTLIWPAISASEVGPNNGTSIPNSAPAVHPPSRTICQNGEVLSLTITGIFTAFAEKDPNTNAIASNKYLILILFLPE